MFGVRKIFDECPIDLLFGRHHSTIGRAFTIRDCTWQDAVPFSISAMYVGVLWLRGIYADEHGVSAFSQCRLLIINCELCVSRVRRTHGWPLEGISVPRSMRKGLAVGLGERVCEAAHASPPQGSPVRTSASRTASAGNCRRQ